MEVPNKMAQGWKKDYTRYKGFFLNILDVYNTKPNVRIYLELILSLGTIIVFALFAIKPTILTIIDINNEIKSKEVTIEKLDKKIADLQTVSGILQNQSENLLLINQSVPSNAELEKLVSQLEKLALNNSVQISSISSSDLLIKGKNEKARKESDFNPLPDNPNELPISFSATGDYQNLLSFLKSVEDLRRPIKFDTLIFNTSKSIDDKKVLTLSISGRVPFLVIENNLIQNEK